MQYQEFAPSERLKLYVKCFYFFESDKATEVEDIVFPGGNMELIFNLGSGIWKTASKGEYHQTPNIELWGQLTKPLPVKSEGKNKMLGIRFYTHGAAFFLKEDLWELNDRVFDARDILGSPIHQLHAQLLETPSLYQRLELLDQFLMHRLFSIERNSDRLSMIGKITKELQTEALSEDIKSLASRYKLTPRYLQKIIFTVHRSYAKAVS